MAYSCGWSFKHSSLLSCTLWSPGPARIAASALRIFFGNGSASSMLKCVGRPSSGVRVFSTSVAIALPFEGFSISTSTMWQATVVHCWKKSFGKYSCKETGMRGSCSVGSPAYVVWSTFMFLLGFPLLQQWWFPLCSAFDYMTRGFGFLIFL